MGSPPDIIGHFSQKYLLHGDTFVVSCRVVSILASGFLDERLHRRRQSVRGTGDRRPPRVSQAVKLHDHDAHDLRCDGRQIHNGLHKTQHQHTDAARGTRQHGLGAARGRLPKAGGASQLKAACLRPKTAWL